MTALLLASGRAGLLRRALSSILPRHGCVTLLAPAHVALPLLEGVEVRRVPIRRFGLVAGLRLARSIGRRWEAVYFLARNPSGAGAENVLGAALALGGRARAISTAGEVPLGWTDYLARRASILAVDLAAGALAPVLWIVSSPLVWAASRRAPRADR